MKTKGLETDTFWDAIPEIDQHEVRYSEYVLKSPKNPTLPKKRQFLAYGVGPIIDCEIDDDDIKPDYSSYILPKFGTDAVLPDNSEEKKTDKKECKKDLKKVKKTKVEMSLDSIYEELHEIKLSKIRKIIHDSKYELKKAKNNPLNRSFLNVAKQLYSTMFNPDQKYCIYMYLREVLDIPPHLFREVQYLYTVIAPEAALIIFQKHYKIDTKNNAIGKLATLELLNPTFYSDKAKTDLYCRT